jgi:hypothetical protein
LSGTAISIARSMTPRYAVTLALSLALIFWGCMLPYEPVVTDTSVQPPGWKCSHGSPVQVVATPACSWIPGGILFESCKQKMEVSTNQQAGCVPDPTTASVWYVIVPPMDDQRRLNPMAPLSQWKPFSWHRTADECNAALASDKQTAKVSRAERFDITHPVDTSREGFTAAAMPYAQCIAKDDPRYKGN